MENEARTRLHLQFRGRISPCIRCPLSKTARKDATQRYNKIKEINQYCNFTDWLGDIAEVHQTVIYEDESGKPKIKENGTFIGRKPFFCKLR